MEQLAYNPQETYIVYFKPESGRLPHHFPKDELQRAKIENFFGDIILDIRGADEPAPRKTKSTIVDTLVQQNLKQKKELEELRKQLAAKGVTEKQLEPIVSHRTNDDETPAIMAKRLHAEGKNNKEISEAIGLPYHKIAKLLK